jgi:hypothetical protein
MGFMTTFLTLNLVMDGVSLSLFFLIKKGKSERLIVTILFRRNHSSTYSLKAAQEEPRQWEPLVFPQVQLEQ